MKNVRSIATLIAVVSVLLFCSACYSDRATTASIRNETLRFHKVDSFVFRYTYGDEHQRADIYEDTKTGVRYLYVWGGMANGGPAITRLWDE